jgi:hypothetical protein
MVHTHNLNTQEAEKGGSGAQGQHGLHIVRASKIE